MNGAPIVPSEPNGHSLVADGVAISDASSSNVLSGLTDLNGQSIEFWLAPNGLPQAADYAYARTGAPGNGRIDRWNVDGTPYPRHFQTCHHHFNVPVPTNGLHHIAYTRQTGGRYRLYLDGALVGDDVAGTFGLATPLNLRGNRAAPPFERRRSTTALYHHQLTSSHAVTHYH